VLELLYGAPYGDATAAVQWLAAAPLVYAAGAVLGAALIAVGRLRGVAIAALGALGVNVALNLLLIPSLSGTGAALATTAAFAVDAALCYAFVAGLLPRLHIVAPLTETLLAAGVMALVLELSPLPLLAELPLAVVAYAAVWLALVRTRRPERLDAVRALLLRGRPAA
jgi:O-antigen/teichoic acid export membrane protein